MWLRILLLPALCAAQGWVYPDAMKTRKPVTTVLTTQKPVNTVLTTVKPVNVIVQATEWLNENLGVNDNSLGNRRFTLNVSNTPSTACTTEGKEGKCVKPHFCTKELPEKDATTLFDYREASCHYLLQCCPLNQVRETPKQPKVLPNGCGWTNPGGYRLRTTDSDTTGFSDYADFPWMVALLKKSHNQAWTAEDYIGGGTLIHPSVVLTVAHKVDSLTPQELKCRAGEWDTKTEEEIYPHQDRDVRKISIHDDFLQLRAHFDAALLFLATPFKLKDVYHIGVACLARDEPVPGSLCYSMGWGASFNDSNNAARLKKIKLPIVDPVTCQRQLRNTRLGSNYLLHHTLSCAGGEVGKDTCIGDGGSSLVCTIPSNGPLTRYAVYGMVAYGVSCGQKDVPGVYAKVPMMIDWINREMGAEQLGTTTYFA